MDEKKIRRLVMRALYKCNLTICVHEIDDICNEIILYRLEGKSKNQLIQYAVIDYCIRHKIIVHHQIAKAHLDNGFPLTRVHFLSDYEIYSRSNDCVEDNVEKSLMIDRAKRYLSDKEYQIFEMFLHGHTQKEIAKKFDTSEASISVTMKSIIRKLRFNYIANYKEKKRS